MASSVHGAQQQQLASAAAATAAIKRGKENEAAEQAKVAKQAKFTEEGGKAASSNSGNGSTSSGAVPQQQGQERQKSNVEIKKEQAPLAQGGSDDELDDHQDKQREATPLPVPVIPQPASNASVPGAPHQPQGHVQQHGIQGPHPHAPFQGSFPSQQPSSPPLHVHPSQGGLPPGLHPAFQPGFPTSFPVQPSAHPSVPQPPTYPDPWLTSPAYEAARQHLTFLNDVLAQLSLTIDEAAWYHKSFSAAAPSPAWLADRHAEVQDIALIYQHSTRRFEMHVASMARRALSELEQVAKKEQWGG